MFRQLLASVEQVLPLGLLGAVTYQGRRFRLRRIYFGKAAYTRDYNNNLAFSELDKIESMMRTVPFGPVFSNIREVLAAQLAISFPGYSIFFANQRHVCPSDMLELMSVAIPCKNKSRYFVLEVQPDGKLIVIADFIAHDCAAVSVRRNGERIELVSRAGEVLLSA